MVSDTEDKDISDVALEYSDLLDEQDKISKRISELRDIIIQSASSGVSFVGTAVSVSKRFSIDYGMAAIEYRKKTGKDPPTVVIPEHETVDNDYLSSWIKREGIKAGKESYTVKRTGRR